MDKKHVKVLKNLLVEEKKRLEDELGEIESGNHEKTPSASTREGAYRTHMADTATETFERERDLSLEANVRDMLERVNMALEKIDRGTYGVCVVCGRQIGVERLKALPYADMCIEDKRKEEAW